jgi:hypothetical protein
MASDSTLRRRAREAKGLCWDCAKPSPLRKRCAACTKKHIERNDRAEKARMVLFRAKIERMMELTQAEGR